MVQGSERIEICFNSNCGFIKQKRFRTLILLFSSFDTITFMLKHVSVLLHSVLLIVFVGSFSSIVYYLNHEPGVAPAEIVTPAPSLSGAADKVPGTGWSLLQPGLERRVINIDNGQSQLVEAVYIWRLDQNYFRMDVAYDQTPRSLETWQKETNASLVVNGGYYSIENERYFPDGLAIAHGKSFGRSFGSGGMLAVKETGAELRWLAEEPYSPFEPLQAALQSFPILVQPGGNLGFGAERENHVGARRTAIAQDREGHILFIVAPQGYFTLHQFSVYLTESDLDLDIAVNLDGGGSTGILVADPREIIPPTRPLPFVILVYPR